MMSNNPALQINIDGHNIRTVPGKTILAVAREHQIDIPTLCFDPRLPAEGSCLLCIVEIEGVAKLQLSCATEIRPGMVIKTKNERIFKARKDALDLLLSNHFADCRGNCYEKCPANIDVQGYLALANAGKYFEALELIRENNPMPLVCGRVCVRYCEGSCRRTGVDSAVGVNFIKRYVGDLQQDALPKPVVLPSNGHKVAVVGGGPGGLTAAYYLALEGFDVTVFDMQPKLGGMVRWGIPDYRLPETVVDKEIQQILDHGIKAKLNTKLGRDFMLDDLLAQGFEAIFLATGSQVAKKMGLKNEEVEGVHGGIYFLDRVKKEGPLPLSGHVLVVGGGNTALDAARTALRCNASKVTIVYRRTRKEMPADSIEIEDALAEGVEIRFLMAPLEVVISQGRVNALKCQEMKLGDPDAGGRRKPVPVDGAVSDIPCTAIIAAIGQDCETGCFAGNKLGELKISKWQTIVVDPKTFATNLPGVFAGGDIVTGPAAVIDAIGTGRRAAKVMSGFLLTGQMIPSPDEFLSKKTNLGELPPDFLASFKKMERSLMAQAPVDARVRSFTEVDHGIKEASILTESSRCMGCGCTSVFNCELKQLANDYNVDQKRFLGRVKKFKTDERHPFITLDMNKCVLCGKCVRLCGELIGVSALGYVNRGFDTAISPSLERPLQNTTCISCGNCIDVCPTGAIDIHYEKPGPWTTIPHNSPCSYCGVGCEMTIQCKNDDLWFIAAKKVSPYHLGELCVRGRFGHRYLRDANRIREAHLRQGPYEVGHTGPSGPLPLSWGPGGERATLGLNEALRKAVAGLDQVAKEHGAGALAFMVSPKATNEEAFLVQKLAREGFGCNNVGSFFSLDQTYEVLGHALGTVASTLPRQQLDDADVIIVIGCDPLEANPVLGFSIRRAEKKGAVLITIGEEHSSISRIAGVPVIGKPGTAKVLFDAIAAALVANGRIDGDIKNRTSNYPEFRETLNVSIDEAVKKTGLDNGQFERLVGLLGNAKKNLVVIGDPETVSSVAMSDLAAAMNVLLLTGRFGKAKNGLLLTRGQANSQGLYDLGICPGSAGKCMPRGAAKLAGVETRKELREMISQGKIKGMLVIGEDPFADQILAKELAACEYLVALDVLETATTQKADLVLPMSALAETAGTTTSLDRRVQAFQPVFPAPSGKMGWQIIGDLVALATEKKAMTMPEIRAQIAKIQPKYSPIHDLGETGSFQWSDQSSSEILFSESFAHADGKARFALPAPKVHKVNPGSAPVPAIDRYFSDQIKPSLAHLKEERKQ